MPEFLESLSRKTGVEKAIEFEQYLRRAAFEKGQPLIGTFELTPRCTLNCRMCYVHLNPDQMDADELTTDQWISLMGQAADAGMLYAVFTGGECLLYPGFFTLYEYLQSRGVLVTVLTNGTLLDEKTVSWLAERTPQRVQVSVYGSSPEEYRSVTGNADAFYRTDWAIDLLKGAKIPFTLAITVSRQMAPNFEAVLRYCRSKKPDRCDVCPFPFQARKETGRVYENYAPTLEQTVEISRIEMRLDGVPAVPWPCEEALLQSATAEEAETEQTVKGITCTAGRIKFSINWRGVMTACNAFNFAEAFPLKDGVAAAWRYINKRSCEYQMPEECRTCAYRRACLPCPAVHWLASGEGRANPLVCAETKRLAMEGLRVI